MRGFPTALLLVACLQVSRAAALEITETRIGRDGAPGQDGESVTITCDEHVTQGIFQTYSEQPAMTLMALVGSGDRLELAIVDENASVMLGVTVGAPVVVSW